MIAADGQAIGDVAAVLFDSDVWKVESLQIRLRKEVADQLGATRGMFHAETLELPVRMIQSVGDAVILSLPAVELRQLLPVQDDRRAGG